MFLTFTPTVVNNNMSAHDLCRHWDILFVADNERECSRLFSALSGKLNYLAKIHQLIFASLLHIFIMKSSYKSMRALFIMEDNTTCKTNITRNFTGSLF